jgi:1-acyl-sn-glycerol-3-phosphate acyltransferase
MKPFYRFSWRVVRALFKIAFGLKIIGSEKVPEDGPLILASNHRSYFDPPLLGISVNREIHFLAKSELFSFRPFGKLITYLNAHPVRRGKKDTRAVDGMVELLKKNEAVAIFPEGSRQKEGKNLGKAKSGVARLAQATHAPILTVYIRGSRKKWRGFLRVDPVSVYFGKMISPDVYGEYGKDPKGYRALATYVLSEIEGLMEMVERERTSESGQFNQ